MKILSDASEYALRAVVWMAHHPRRAHKVQEIARGAATPSTYLVKVLQSLAKQGILSAMRGSRGGFTLVRNPKDLSLLEVVNAVDPIRRITACPLGVFDHQQELCPLHKHIDQAIQSILESLEKTTVDDITQATGKGGPFCSHSRGKPKASHKKN